MKSFHVIKKSAHVYTGPEIIDFLDVCTCTRVEIRMWLNLYNPCTDVYKVVACVLAGSLMSYASMRPGCFVPAD